MTLFSVQCLFDVMSMIDDGRMLKKLSNANSAPVKVKHRFVAMIELDKNERVTTDGENTVSGRNLTALKKFTPKRMNGCFKFVSWFGVLLVVCRGGRREQCRKVGYRKTPSIQFSIRIQW